MMLSNDLALNISFSSSSAEQTFRKMLVVRGPKRKAIEADLQMAKKKKVGS